MKTYVLYHAGCADGFGAAFAAWLCLGESAEYLPVSHSNPIPTLEDGSGVYIVDFSYPREKLHELCERMHHVVVLDHHKTAAEELERFTHPRARIIFDNERSGAVLSWRFFFPQEPIPWLLRYVQDRDLYQWYLPESREVSAALATYPKEFQLWTEFLSDHGLNRLRDEGRVALRLIRQQARELANRGWLEEVGGFEVPVVNTAVFIDETCEELLELYPDAKFVACVREANNGLLRWSLRSRPGFNCSEIAVRFGGGGHPQAAGFETVVGARSAPVKRLELVHA